MKCLFLNVYYDDFLRDHYGKNKIDHLEYMEQWDSIQGTFFGDSDFYSFNLEKQGWQAHDLITNCKPLQKAWAKENDYRGDHPIWVEQIIRNKPDVIYSQGLWLINDETYPMIKDHCRLIVGHVGYQLDNFSSQYYDLIFTNNPPYVDKFHEAGVESRYMPMAFDRRIWERVKDLERIYPITFVGNVTAGHKRRKEVLNLLQDHFDVRYWIGELWGIDMFRVLAQSQITINCNHDYCRPYVGNMRLFEGTGCGALVVTDHGTNLHELFDLDELVTYRSPEDAVHAIEQYLNFSNLRQLVAKNGQRRTLADHTYENRMEKVAAILESLL